MRLYTAVELPAPLRERIAEQAWEIVRGPGGRSPRGVKAVAVENLHVTVREWTSLEERRSRCCRPCQ